ncbi:MAG: AlpA family phage regulatory protein [Gammaproteobacteria bacterium]|nr:MAG: AlpA family phage regulatory protein [Gammaproteobacteria bacterium]
MTAIYRPKAAAEYIGVAVSTLYRWAADSDFPKPLKLGRQASGWRKADLDAWLERKAKEGEAA